MRVRVFGGERACLAWAARCHTAARSSVCELHVRTEAPRKFAETLRREEERWQRLADGG